MTNNIKCPYCGSKAVISKGNKIYGGLFKSSYNFWICENYPNCDSYVGCHGRTTTPLGSLANKNLRMWRKNAHTVFDTLWKTKGFSREYAYKWLAKKMAIKPENCHIGQFDADQCKEVIKISKVIK